MMVFPFIAANQIRQIHATKSALWEAPKIRKSIASNAKTLEAKPSSDMTSQVKTASLAEMTSLVSNIESFNNQKHESQLQILQNGKLLAADSLETKTGTDNTSLVEIAPLVSNITSFDDVKNDSQFKLVPNGTIPNELYLKRKNDFQISYLRCLAIFYQAPAVKFLIHMLHFMCVLPAYSLLFLYVTRSFLISDWEKLLLLCNISYFIESVDILMKFRGPIKLKFKLWFRSEWNLIQAASSALGIVAFVLKLIYLQVSKCN